LVVWIIGLKFNSLLFHRKFDGQIKLNKKKENYPLHCKWMSLVMIRQMPRLNCHSFANKRREKIRRLPMSAFFCKQTTNEQTSLSNQQLLSTNYFMQRFA